VASSEPAVSGPGAALAGDLPLSDILQRVFEDLPMGVVVYDDQLEVLFQNPQAQLLLIAAEHTATDGEPLATTLARGAINGVKKDWAVELRAVLGATRPRRFDRVEYRNGDQQRLLQLTCAPLAGGAPPANGVLLADGSNDCANVGYLLVEDVSADKSLVKRLAVSERYAAVGKLAARVAHELNNPLDGILRYINLTERTIQPAGQEKPTSYLDEARRGLMRMARIISDLLEYSRSSAVAPEENSINDVVEDAIKAMEDRTRQGNVTIVCAFASELPRVHGASLLQVFCNLIKNAADAMPDGGQLVITTRRHESEAYILFEDNGVGLPGPDINRIFEPFYSTKRPGEGTGLGLAICRNLIEDKYHGTITAENQPEGGARFIIRIPLEMPHRGQTP